MRRTSTPGRRRRTTARSPNATAPGAPSSPTCASSSACSTGPAPACPNPNPPEEPACEPGEPRNEPRDEPRPYVSDYDGSEDEFHYGGEVYVGSQETPEFKAWLAEVERRAGPVPKDPDHPDRPVSCTFDERQFIGDLNSPEYREWRDRHQRRVTEELERLLNGDDDDDDADGHPQAQPITPPAPPERYAPTPPHDKT